MDTGSITVGSAGLDGMEGWGDNTIDALEAVHEGDGRVVGLIILTDVGHHTSVGDFFARARASAFFFADANFFRGRECARTLLERKTKNVRA